MSSFAYRHMALNQIFKFMPAKLLQCFQTFPTLFLQCLFMPSFSLGQHGRTQHRHKPTVSLACLWIQEMSQQGIQKRDSHNLLRQQQLLLKTTHSSTDRLALCLQFSPSYNFQFLDQFYARKKSQQFLLCTSLEIEFQLEIEFGQRVFCWIFFSVMNCF